MLQAGVGCLPLDQAGEFLEPSQLGLVGGDHLPLPSLLLPVHGVHPVEVGGKEGGLLPPYPGADLQKHVLPFHRVFGAEEGAEGGLQPGQLLLGLGLLGLGQGPVLRILQEFFQPCQVRAGPLSYCCQASTRGAKSFCSRLSLATRSGSA